MEKIFICIAVTCIGLEVCATIYFTFCEDRWLRGQEWTVFLILNLFLWTMYCGLGLDNPPKMSEGDVVQFLEGHELEGCFGIVSSAERGRDIYLIEVPSPDGSRFIIDSGHNCNVIGKGTRINEKGAVVKETSFFNR